MIYQKMWCKKDRDKKRIKRLHMLQEKERKLASETSTDSTCQLKPMTPFNSKKKIRVEHNIKNPKFSAVNTFQKC